MCTEALKAALPGFPSFNFISRVRKQTQERNAIFHPINESVVFVLTVGALDQHPLSCVTRVHADGARALKCTFAFTSEHDLHTFVHDICVISVGVRPLVIDQIHNRLGIMGGEPVPVWIGRIICESSEIHLLTAVNVDGFKW